MSYVMPKYNRLTDNDTRWGPITIGEKSKTWRPIGATLQSGGEEYRGASLNFYLYGRTVRVAIPAIIKPWRRWVDTSKYAWANSSGGYWDIHPREYGFRLSDGFLQVFFGAQTHDSRTDQNWCTHLPWTQWRYVGIRWYDLDGKQCAALSAKAERAFRADGNLWTVNLHRWIEDGVPTVSFQAKDYDGEIITATTRIEERECRFGEGWFKWLSLLRKPRIHRTLSIEFDKEVGYEKGSWKGGLMGTGIALLPGELHEDAFRRFCANGVSNKSGISPLEFIGKTPSYTAFVHPK